MSDKINLIDLVPESLKVLVDYVNSQVEFNANVVRRLEGLESALSEALSVTDLVDRVKKLESKGVINWRLN